MASSTPPTSIFIPTTDRTSADNTLVDALIVFIGASPSGAVSGSESEPRGGAGAPSVAATASSRLPSSVSSTVPPLEKIGVLGITRDEKYPNDPDSHLTPPEYVDPRYVISNNRIIAERNGRKLLNELIPFKTEDYTSLRKTTILQLLEDNTDIDVNFIDKVHRTTPLFMVCTTQGDHDDIVRLLIAKGVDIYMNTPIAGAIATKNYKIVNILLKKVMDDFKNPDNYDKVIKFVNSRGYYEESLLEDVFLVKNPTMIAQLLLMGAKFKVDGLYHMLLAMSNPDGSISPPEMRRLCLLLIDWLDFRMPASLNYRRNGKTPITIANCAKYAEIVGALVGKGIRKPPPESESCSIAGGRRKTPRRIRKNRRRATTRKHSRK